MYRSITNNILIPSVFAQGKQFIKSKISREKVEFPFSIDCTNAQKLEFFLNEQLSSSSDLKEIVPTDIFVNKNNKSNIKINKINITLKMFYVINDDKTGYSFNELKYLDEKTKEKKCKDYIRSSNKNSKDEATLSAKQEFQDTTRKSLKPVHAQIDRDILEKKKALERLALEKAERLAELKRKKQ